MHHTTKRAMTTWVAAVGALALVAAACSSGATKANGSSGSPPTVPAPTTSRPAPTASTASGPTSTGTGTGTTPTTAPTSSSTIATTATTAATTAAPTAAPAGPTLDGLSVTLTKVAELPDPIAMAVRAGDPLLYVASKTGIVYALEGDGPKALLDISGDVSTGSEQGLLGLAFAPDGSHVYLSFTDTSGTSVVADPGGVSRGQGVDYAALGHGDIQVADPRTAESECRKFQLRAAQRFVIQRHASPPASECRRC